jgi:hypothetical protein
MKEQQLELLTKVANGELTPEQAQTELWNLFSVMVSASPTLDNIDYNYEKDKFYQIYNKNEYYSSELISVYGLDADELCKIMLSHLP